MFRGPQVARDVTRTLAMQDNNREWNPMKRIIIAAVLALGATTFVGAPAQAVSWSACNQGTANAAHLAPGKAFYAPGIQRLGYFCHGIG